MGPAGSLVYLCWSGWALNPTRPPNLLIRGEVPGGGAARRLGRENLGPRGDSTEQEEVLFGLGVGLAQEDPHCLLHAGETS